MGWAIKEDNATVGMMSRNAATQERSCLLLKVPVELILLVGTH